MKPTKRPDVATKRLDSLYSRYPDQAIRKFSTQWAKMYVDDYLRPTLGLKKSQPSPVQGLHLASIAGGVVLAHYYLNGIVHKPQKGVHHHLTCGGYRIMVAANPFHLSDKVTAVEEMLKSIKLFVPPSCDFTKDVDVVLAASATHSHNMQMVTVHGWMTAKEFAKWSVFCPAETEDPINGRELKSPLFVCGSDRLRTFDLLLDTVRRSGQDVPNRLGGVEEDAVGG